MNQMPVKVDSVRRANEDASLIYRLNVGATTRTLALHKAPKLDVAIVSNDANYLLAILMSLEAADGTKHRTLIRFGDRDDATSAILKPQAIADLRTPQAQTARWKNVRSFRLITPATQTHLITHAPVGNYVMKDTLEDAFCRPSVTTQLNSAMNACFRQLCAYVKCAKKSVQCREEEAAVNAFCFARGSEDG